MKIVNILFNYSKKRAISKILGVERCFIDYGKGLMDSGNEVISISKPNMIFADAVRDSGVKYYEIPAIGTVDIYSVIKLAMIFRDFKPDVIICHSGRAMVLSNLALRLIFKKIPIVGIDHGINPKKFFKADFALVVNKFFANEMVKFGKDSDRVLTIPNMMQLPVNFKTITKDKFPKKIRIGSLGRLFPEKNFDKVIKAMAILRDNGIESSYVIGGVGKEYDNLQSLAKNLNLENNFKILGWVDDKKEFFENIDIFILPSWGETFGIVLLEAMMYSTPIIASNSWGPDDIITNEFNGIKISKDDEEQVPQLIADAVEKLINNQQLAKEIARNAYDDFLENYTSQKVLQKLEDILKIAVEKGVTKK